MMKDTYSRITTTKVIGYLTRNDNGDFVVEVYDKKDEEPIIVSVEEMLRDKVYGVIGNRSRVNADKKSNMPAENFERLIFKHIELRLPNVRVCMNGLEDWITFKVKDQLVFMTHGDKDSLSNIKLHSVNLLGRVPDRIYFGHIHYMNIKDDNGTEIVVNGSISGVDEFAMSLRCNTKPYQVLQVFDNDVCTYKINL